MRIIIVGCGKVGSELAGQLSAAGHDLTLIDLSERRLDELSNTYDLATVKGSGTSYHVLREAGVQDTDLLIAVTTHDEINLLSCLIARQSIRLPRHRACARSGICIRPRLYPR